MKRIEVAERIISAYREREGAENWAEWADKHPGKAALLGKAMKAVQTTEAAHDGE